MNSLNAWKCTKQMCKSNSELVPQISIETVMKKVLLNRIVQDWKLLYQVISRSKKLVVKHNARIVNNLLFAWKVQQKCSVARSKQMLATLRVWKSVKQSRLVQFEAKMHSIKTVLIAWIHKRRTAKSAIAAVTKEVKVNTSMVLNADDSIMIQGLQESNLDYTIWSIESASKISDQVVKNKSADDVDEITGIKSKTVKLQNIFNTRVGGGVWVGGGVRANLTG